MRGLCVSGGPVPATGRRHGPSVQLVSFLQSPRQTHANTPNKELHP